MTCRIYGAFVAALLSLLLPSFADAQATPDPSVRLMPQQASSFAPAFTALAQQAHVAVVAEDQPLHPALTPQAIAGLKLKGGGEPLSTLLPKLAAAYDYDVQPSGKVFLLKKRYTDAADLPSTTVKECTLGLEEASRYAEGFNPHFPNGDIVDSPAMKDLIYSLTPEQLEAMKDIKRGVPVASLAPAQQQEVQQFVMLLWIQKPSGNLPATVGALNRVAATDPQFSWRDYPQFHTRLFGYDATLAGGQRIFVTMSNIDQIQSSLDGGMRISPRMEGGVPQVAGYLAPGDLTGPLPTPANAPPPLPPASASLAEIIARLNARADDGLKVTVEPYLAPKRATAFGEAWATPRQELAALADVYGLRVFTGDKEGGKDRLRLTRQTARAPLDVVALHTAILQALPDPLVRACHMHSAFAPFNPEAPSPIPSGLSPLLVYAVRQIRTAAEPKIKASKDGKVALSSLSEKEGRAFAVVLMADPMESLSGWTTADLPWEVTRFNDMRLSGGLYEKDGKKLMDLLLALPNPKNPSTLQQGMGVGEINYDPVKQTL